MFEIKARLIEKVKRTPTVTSFRFRPEEKINFTSGQFLEVIFDEQNRQNRFLNKYLSFSSSLDKDYFEVTKRISESQFSRYLVGLKEGDGILFKGPLGNCVFKEEYAKIGFLIGGIGITPVISILEYIANKGLSTDACLLYSNKTEEEIAFKPELDTWSKINPNIKVTHILSGCEPKDKKCFFGRIDKDFLLTHISDYQSRHFFIFGPPAMVQAMKELCYNNGCPENTVMTENFVGY